MEDEITDSSRVSQLKRFGALGEVLFVILAANLILRAIQAAGLTPAVLGISAEAGALNARAGLVEGFFIALKFTFALLIGFGLLKWLCGLRLRDAGITAARQPLTVMLIRGGVLGCAAALPWLTLMAADSVLHFGEGVAGWQLIEETPWSTGFVVYVLATMVLIPPIMEECTMRGYVRTRLQIAFGPVGAALISAVVFVLAHGHFYGLDAVLIGTQITLIYAFAVLAYDTYRSGSVIPAIIAHALINLPIPRNLTGMSAALAVAIVVLVRAQPAVTRELEQLRQDWAATEARGNIWLWTLTGGALMAAAIIYRPSVALLILFALAGIGVSIRQNRRLSKSSAPTARAG